MSCVQVILVYVIAGCSPISCPIMSNSKVLYLCTPSNRYIEISSSLGENGGQEKKSFDLGGT